jgi:leucine dehydrogenase
VAKALRQSGGEVIAADPDAEKCKQAQLLGMKIVSTEEILFQPCDVLVPCALGGIIHADNVQHLRCKIIAGSANNQLADNSIAEMLQQRDILYAPDYVINSGGLIFASMQYHAQNPLLEHQDDPSFDLQTNEKINQKIRGIYSTLMSIFQQAKASNKNINQVANELAQQRLSASGKNAQSDKGAVYDAA